MARGLAVIHVDGVGADSLEAALREGDMPFVQHLIDTEGYVLQRYRCGVPSTTPFAQAGILYGDNSEIPSFRWWDRERRLLVQFGAASTFKKVADRYFRGTHPLTERGACIAACYPGGADETFGIAYQDRSYAPDEKSRSALDVLVPYLLNPIHLGDWVWQMVAVAGRTVVEYVTARSHGRRPARVYVFTNAIEEIFVHHLTRYAVHKAMRRHLSPIYAAFYAFDEAGHAFGPDDPSSLAVLRHVDRTLRRVARSAAADGYELVILSDHGQIETVPFWSHGDEPFGAVLAGLLPGFRVREMKGKAFGPSDQEARGHVNVTSSGGLAHIYFDGREVRMPFSELIAAHPDLVVKLSAHEKIALVMARDGERDYFFQAGRELEGDALRNVLAGYDDPEILHAQLSRLNSFRAAGDLVLFGRFMDGRQVNFENQAGGHGSIGGEQLHPFVLARKGTGLDVSHVNGAHELHPLLSALRDRLKT
jgi:Type I phosphodiesterase / nucleotide pyrophosphatase